MIAKTVRRRHHRITSTKHTEERVKENVSISEQRKEKLEKGSFPLLGLLGMMVIYCLFSPRCSFCFVCPPLGRGTTMSFPAGTPPR